jgi:hypothetical protein
MSSKTFSEDTLFTCILDRLSASIFKAILVAINTKMINEQRGISALPHILRVSSQVGCIPFQ